MNTKFTLDYEVVDNIVKASLLELYKELKKDMEEKKEADFDILRDFQNGGDYKYDETLLEATKILVCYYTSPEERPEELMNL